MGDDDYEILPSKDIEDLKKQLEAYRSGPSGSARASVDTLNDSIIKLINIFREASESMKFEEEEQDLIEKEIAPMADKVDKVLDQNKKIAEGIVALADMINEVKEAMEILNDKIEAMQTQLKEKPAMPAFRPQQQSYDMQQPQPFQGFGGPESFGGEELPLPPLGAEGGMGRPGQLPPLPPLR